MEKNVKNGTYLRNKETGDLAQVIEKDGKQVIKPDLPGSPVFYPMTQLHRWNEEKSPGRLPPGTLARVAYAADQALCDIHPDMRRQKDWMSLHPEQKAAWIEGKHKFDHVLRLELFNAIMKVLEGTE